MSNLTFERCAELGQVLSEAEPEAALERALRWLSELGVEQLPVDDRAAWLTVQRGERVLRLSASSPPDAVVTTLIAGLLKLALDRLVAQEESRRAREQLEMLSGASFEGIMIHVDGSVIFANDRLAELLRCEPHEVLGDQTMRTCVAPEDLASVMQRIASGYEGAYIITGVRKDGTRFRAELQSKQGRLGQRPVRVAAVRDVTEREQTFALLRESEARLRDLTDTLFDVTVFSRDGVVIEVAGPLESMLGYRKEDCVGRNLLDFVPPSLHPMVEDILDEQRAGSYRSTLVATNGTLVPVEIVAVHSTVDGLPTRVAGIRDLRAQQRLEDERRKLEQQLQRAQRLHSLGVLAGGIAHDFNNLLTGVLGNAHLLLEQVHDADGRESVDAIISAGNQAASLTAQMLAYAGKADLVEPAPVDVSVLLSELRTLLAASLSKKAEIVLDLEDHTIVVAERTTLSQVLMNLLTNASDALGGEFGTLSIRTRHISEPDARWDDAFGATVYPGMWVLVEIEDTGVGMDSKTLARAFEPFFTTKPDGHGLGLAACLGIVQAHKGALHVRSHPGDGTCFSLLLPRSPARESSEPRTKVVERGPCRVLVVDDDALVRTQLRRSLELRGYHVEEAVNGRDGLTKLQTDGTDVVVLDLSMPHMDGVEVITALRSRGNAVPVVLSSGHFTVSTERRLSPGSFQAFLRKPYGVEELIRAIERARSRA